MPSAFINSSLSGFARSYSVNNKTGEVSPAVIIQTTGWDVYRMTRSSVTTPNYKSDRRKGSIRKLGLPMNPFSFTLHRYRGPTGHENTRVVDTNPQTFSDITYHLEGQLRENNDQLNVTRPTGSQINALDGVVRTRTLLDMKDQKTNLVQVYAERHQTERLWADTARKVVGVFTGLRAGNLAGAYRSLGLASTPRKVRKYKKRFSQDPDKAISNAWLELQYGWRPLLNDVYGAAELIAQKNLREVRTRVRKSASLDWNDQWVTVSNDLSYGTNTAKYRYTIAYTVYYSTPSDSIKTLSQVGVTNPELIAWELTPWSFVIDWLLPIGNFLSSLDATSGLVFEKGCKTTFFRYQQSNYLRGGRSANATSYTVRDTNRHSEREYIECNRTTLASWPRTSLPSFKNPFSGEHLANALGLLNQLHKR
jgi:hypothetical protein